MSPLRHLVLFGTLAVSAFAQTTPTPAATPAAPTPAPAVPAPKEIVLEVARTENEVSLTWTLPEGEVRMLEIMRNTSSNAQGRDRIGTTRATVKVYSDRVPDAAATYWYWIKITRPTGEIINSQPVPTPSAKVWSPTS
jgi:predicted phage tail protein